MIYIPALFIIAAVTIIFCRPVLRPDDALAQQNNYAKIYTSSKTIIIVNCILAVLFTFILLGLHSESGSVSLIGLIIVVAMGSLAYYAYDNRGTYYVVDDHCITHIARNKPDWSYRWEEISEIRRRVVCTGKITIVYYDLICKDGTIHRSLPNSMRKQLSEHFPITSNHNGLTAFLLILLTFISFFILFFLITK